MNDCVGVGVGECERERQSVRVALHWLGGEMTLLNVDGKKKCQPELSVGS